MEKKGSKIQVRKNKKSWISKFPPLKRFFEMIWFVVGKRKLSSTELLEILREKNARLEKREIWKLLEKKGVCDFKFIKNRGSSPKSGKLKKSGGRDWFHSRNPFCERSFRLIIEFASQNCFLKVLSRTLNSHKLSHFDKPRQINKTRKYLFKPQIHSEIL